MSETPVCLTTRNRFLVPRLNFKSIFNIILDLAMKHFHHVFASCTVLRSICTYGTYGRLHEVNVYHTYVRTISKLLSTVRGLTPSPISAEYPKENMIVTSVCLQGLSHPPTPVCTLAYVLIRDALQLARSISPPLREEICIHAYVLVRRNDVARSPMCASPARRPIFPSRPMMYPCTRTIH